MNDATPFDHISLEVFIKAGRYRLTTEYRAGSAVPVEHDDLEALLKIAQRAGELELAARSIVGDFAMSRTGERFTFAGRVQGDETRCEARSLLQLILDAYREQRASAEKRIK